MGVIKRQSIKQSLANYFGVVIGAISTLFIFPLAAEAVGLLRFIVATATLTLPIVSLGVNGIVIRFFPEFKDKNNGDNGFLGFIILIVLSGFGIFLVAIWLFKTAIFDFYNTKPPEYLEYLPFVIPLVFFLAMINVFKLYSSNFQRVVVPYIVYELFLKFAFPTLILLFLGEYLGLDGLVWGITITYFAVLLMLVGYLWHLGAFNIKLKFPFLRKEARLKRMRTFGVYGLLGSLGGILAFQIDVFMVGNLITLYATGVYSMSLFIANTIDIPMRAVNSITPPIISTAWKENNLTEIHDLYKKTSINLTLFGIFIFLLIWLNLDDLFSLIPRGDILMEGKYVVLFLGLAKLIDQVTSINGYIISYSPFFRFNFYAVIFLGALNISLNLYLIPKYGITGAALASMVSIIFFNGMKVVFIYFRLKMHPFSLKTLLTVLVAGASFLVIYFLPMTTYAFLNMSIKGLLLLLFYGGLVLYLNLSEEASSFVKTRWKNK